MKQCAIWETLAPLEWARLSLQYHELCGLPRGDGHKVIVLPGFCTGENSTRILRTMLIDQGYDAEDWGQGINFGPNEQMTLNLHQLIMESPEPVSLVGWSLGGLYARALANTLPHKVRRVVTLASPHRGDPSKSRLQYLFRALNPGSNVTLPPEVMNLIRNDPPVPLTSIYSKRDGVVDWKDCITEAENVEVSGSHMGMTINPDVIRIIFERLPQR